MEINFVEISSNDAIIKVVDSAVSLSYSPSTEKPNEKLSNFSTVLSVLWCVSCSSFPTQLMTQRNFVKTKATKMFDKKTSDLCQVFILFSKKLHMITIHCLQSPWLHLSFSSSSSLSASFRRRRISACPTFQAFKAGTNLKLMTDS